MIQLEVDLSGIKRLKKAIEDIIPAAERAMTRYIEQDALSDFETITKTWDHQVDFAHSVTYEQASDTIIGEVSTDDPAFVIVNNGVDEHPIFPKRAKFLRWQVDFKPKTKKGWIGSQDGGKSGPWTRRRFVLRHKIEAREWTKAIAEKTQNLIIKRFKEELRKL